VTSRMLPRRITVILNPAAGTENEASLGERLRGIFAQHEIACQIDQISSGDEIIKAAEAAVRSGHEAVVAGGGDGTVNAVASALVGTQCALGVLPVGTLNHFAKDLGIPLDIVEAAHATATGEVRAVDVGEVNGKIFINNSGLGLYPSVVRGRNQQQRLGRSKKMAFFWAVLSVLRRYPLLQVCFTTDTGDEFTRLTPVVFIGNNKYEMKGFEIGSRHSLEGGKLAVYVARHHCRWGLIRMGIEAILGRLHRGIDFDFVSTEEIKIETKKKMLNVSADGEVSKLIPPLIYRIRPLALRVIAPRQGKLY
jgi:diacylglycerol kinase family enzyme